MKRSVILLGVLVMLLAAGLPMAAWLDLSALSERQLRRQAEDMARIIDRVRDYYATDVVGRVMAAHGQATASSRYRELPGAIPIPATFSLELSQIFGAGAGTVDYRFVSDYPFRGREPHRLDSFERQALAVLRADPPKVPSEVSGSLFDRSYRLVVPVLMAQTCVDCHNSDPDSPRHDWQAGDVRGIEAITVRQRIDNNAFAFRWLLLYLGVLIAAGVGVIAMEHRSGLRLAGLNHRPAEANAFLAGISEKIAKYIAPQIYRSIFSGEKEAKIATERKKLTIFFSDIAGFTATTERMQPEDLTHLLNDYFSEMTALAHAHGGTVDKFIGDALVIFFGDPASRGVAEDARACVRMAIAMQRRLGELDERWQAEGLARPFRARIGINTGFVNVGNFGSDERMDYTIVGATANLAARLQQHADPGGIVLGYETNALVQGLVETRAMPAIAMKGISEPVTPYAVVIPSSDAPLAAPLETRHAGLHLHLDPSRMDDAARDAARASLMAALRRLDWSG